MTLYSWIWVRHDKPRNVPRRWWWWAILNTTILTNFFKVLIQFDYVTAKISSPFGLYAIIALCDTITINFYSLIVPKLECGWIAKLYFIVIVNSLQPSLDRLHFDVLFTFLAHTHTSDNHHIATLPRGYDSQVRNKRLTFNYRVILV